MITGLRARRQASKNVLEWDAYPSASGYDIERDGIIVAKNVQVNSYQDSVFSDSVYRVRAVIVNPQSNTGAVNHGGDLPAYSLEAEQYLDVPQPNTLPTLSGPFSGTQVIENRQIDGQARIVDGADITFYNCVFLAGAGQDGYLVRINEGGEAKIKAEKSLFVQRTGMSGNTAKLVVGWNPVNMHFKGCVFRGGVDSIVANVTGQGEISTGDPLVPLARFLVEDSWIGDNERVGSSHSDLIQMDGVARGYAVIRRNRFMGFSLPEGVDTLTTRVTDYTTNQMSSTCFIITDASAPSNDAEYIAIRDNWFDGGNFVVDTNDSASGPIEITGNLWGLRRNFGSRSGLASVNQNNRYGESGETKEPSPIGTITVSEGDLIPGSIE